MAKKMKEALSSIFRSFKVTIALGRRSAQVKYAYFAWIFPFELIDLLMGILSWYFYALTFGAESPLLAPYGGDFIAYLILGLSLNRFFTYNIGQFYYLIRAFFGSAYGPGGQRLSSADYHRLFKVSVSTLLAAHTLWEYFKITLRFFLYIFIGFLLGMRFSPSANIMSYLLVFIMGMVATIGLGLISASMCWIIGIYHGKDPIQWFAILFGNIASGVYFPPEILPNWLRYLGALLPQTYALKLARLTLIAGLGIEELIPDMLILTLQSIIFATTGAILISYSLRIADKRGTLIR